MKKFLLLIILTLTLSGCDTAAGSYQHLTPEDAAKVMETEKNFIILDVRTQDEYDKKHIPNAVLLPIEELRKGNFELLPDKKQKILIYCWTGRRAEDSAKILAEHGYKNVYEFGGLVDWNGKVVGNEIKN